MNRRSFLQGAGCVSAGLLRGADGPERPLRDHAAARGLLYGAAAAYGPLRNDPDYTAHFAEECGILVPENVLKWSLVHPAPDRYDFVPGDFLAGFAAKHEMKMRGHNLVWHNQLPTWFSSVVTKGNARDQLEGHIRHVASHYRGRMHSWDVVNEAVLPGDGRSDGLRKTRWLELLGPEYLEIAHSAAAEADPDALLVYNDYGLDYVTPEQEAKRAAVLSLLRGLKKRNIPLHGFGMQAHLSAREQKAFQPSALRRFFSEVAALGLKILITEMDVSDQGLPDDTAVRDRAIADVYSAYLTAALAEPAVIAVLTWGLTDRYTWLAKERPRSGGAGVRVLPLDADYRRTPAWEAMAKAFDARA
jgi:endo-1,4-beta-xylanase